jgi:hypothetical protein
MTHKQLHAAGFRTGGDGAYRRGDVTLVQYGDGTWSARIAISHAGAHTESGESPRDALTALRDRWVAEIDAALALPEVAP